MIKDVLGVMLKTAGDVAQSYFQQQAAESASKHTPEQWRRLLVVMGIGFAIGFTIIFFVCYFQK
jgi:capsular polysaccharide biosynthesis protein